MPTAVTAQFGGDTSNLRAAAQTAGGIITGFAEDADAATGGLFDRIENRLLGTRAIATALGTALGLHLQEMATNLARLFTGVSDDAEAELKNLAELSQKSADQTIAAGLARLDNEQKLTLLLQQQASTQAAFDALQASVIDKQTQFNAAAEIGKEDLYETFATKEKQMETDEESNQLQIDKNKLTDLGLELEKIRAAILADQNAQRDLANKSDEEAQALAETQLPLFEKQKELQADVFELETNINTARAMGVDVSQQDVSTLQQKQKELVVIGDQIDKNAVADSAANNKDMDAIQALVYAHEQFVAQQTFQALPVEEQLTQLQQKRADLMAQVYKFGADSLPGARAQAAVDAIDTGLFEQRVAFLKQILALEISTADVIKGAQGDLATRNELSTSDRTNLEASSVALGKQIDATKETISEDVLRNGTETAGTENMENQLQILIDQKNTVDELLNAWSGGPLGRQDLGNLSTASLQASLVQMQTQLAADAASIHNDAVTGTTAANSDVNLESQIGSIQQQLAFRQNFTSAYNSGGVSGALSFYTQSGGNALSFDQALSSMSSWGTGLTVGNQSLAGIQNSVATIAAALVG